MTKSAEALLEDIKALLGGSSSDSAASILANAANNYGLGKDFAWNMAKEGRIFYASDADQNDLVLGQTSFVNTTPTFLLQNPSNSERIVVPLMFTLNQAGSVAGGDVNVVAEIDNADRYSSGGTEETVLSSRPLNPVSGGNKAKLWSNPTALSGYGVRTFGITTGPDVSPAEGALQEILWTPTSGLDILDPGSSMQIYTWAGATGPSWYWTFKWLEITAEILALL